MSYNPFELKDFRDGERVVALVRHHWFVLFREVFWLAVLFIAPFFLIPVAFGIAAQGGGLPSIPGGAVIFFASLWALIIWHLLFARWTDYYYDLWIITNWRIIDIDQIGFFNRNVATLLTLDHIQDIETHVDGIVGTVLNFGSIKVQTAAARAEFLMSEIPNPVNIEKTIREAQEEKLRVFGAKPEAHG